jgi:hypothetical protein
MAKATPNFPETPTNIASELTATDTTVAKDITAAATAGLRIDMLGVSSNDSSHDVTFTVSDGTNDRLQWTVTIPANAGNVAGTPPVNAISRTVCPWLNDDGAFWLQQGWKLRWNAVTAVSAAKAIRCTGFGAAWV